jgi:hypothetical protein
MQTISKNQKSSRITNYMEVLTEDILEGILPEYKGVKFNEDAKKDIKAFALNRLWPMYVTTSDGKNFVKKIVVEDKIEKDVVRELRAAIDKVRSNPR